MIYIHEIAVALQKSPFGCKKSPVECGGVLQADGIAIMALTAPCVATDVNRVCQECIRRWRHQCNSAKWKVLVLGESCRGKKLTCILCEMEK